MEDGDDWEKRRDCRGGDGRGWLYNREREGGEEEGGVGVGTACRREVDANRCRLAGTRAAAAGNWPCPEQPACPGLACTTLALFGCARKLARTHPEKRISHA